MDLLELEPGEYEAAVERARVRAETEPHATAARYDKRLRMVLVALHTGLTVAFRPADVQGLESATAADLSAIELDADGFGLHFPTLDADVWLPGLLAGHFGSKNWTAARLGQAGGRSRSPAKTAASRANGKLGGRPRNSAA
jgi:hypothetical protein